MRDGRPPADGPGKTRDHRLTVRLNEDDANGIEETRGALKPTEFARDAIREKIQRVRGRK